MEPLKEWALHKIYVEKAEIAVLIENLEVSSRKTLQVRVQIKPASQIDVADGLITLIYDSNYFELAPGSSKSFNVKKSSSMRILDEGDFKLLPKARESQTISQVKAIYETKYGHHESAPVSVKLLADQVNDSRPFIEKSGTNEINLSGTWKIAIGGNLGGMTILQDKKDVISGKYWMGTEAEGTKLPIEGWKDGTAFKVF